jgi:trk system potassium uptake protein TrkA
MNGRAKRVCVVGLGQFGAGLARALAKHCEVLALDQDAFRVNAIADQVQQARILDARDHNALASVVSPDFDEAIVSIGETMEASVLCTLHLRRIGIKVVRVKAAGADHAEILKAVGATQVIFPEQEAAERLATRILNPNLLDYVPVARDYRVTDLAAPAAFHGHTLASLQIRNRFGSFVIAVKKPGSDAFVFLPGPDYVVQAHDVLVVIGREADIVRMGDAETAEA